MYVAVFLTPSLLPLPPLSPDEIRDAFIQFGGLTVDWPHKAQSKAYFPPKGVTQAHLQPTSQCVLVHEVCIACPLTYDAT